jgi:hypothetical protein
LDQEIRDLKAIHQWAQRKREKMLRLADLQKKIDEAAEEMHHLTQDASPLAAELQAIPWPQSYKPPQLPMYDVHSNPKQFLMSYEATVSSYGGNAAVMAKSFVLAVRSVA